MEQKDIQKWSSVLNTARIKALPIAQISGTGVSMTRNEAYQIQELGLMFRLEQKEKHLGYKMGLTSEAKRKQMNLDSSLYGVLTDKMQLSHQGQFQLPGSIHPKIEPEVAFLIKEDLPRNPSREQVLKSTAGICACLEILDSRYQQFKYFSMEDVIADNSSSSHFVLGPWQENFSHLDLKNLKMQMWINDQLAQSGISSDISGDPVQSVIELCELLGQRNQSLKKNSIVLAGAATLAVALEPGMQVKLEVTGLADVEISIK